MTHFNQYSGKRPARYLNWRRILGHAGLYLVLIGGAAIVLLPLLWMVTTALKAENIVYELPPKFFPTEFVFSNFREAMDAMNFWALLQNTMLITALSLAGAMFANPLVAFGFARLNFRGRNALFFFLVATMALPSQVVMIPLYMTFLRMGLVNTYIPLILPSFTGSAFFIFLLRQFFMGIPWELDEAATIDGCSTFGIFLRIMLPLSVPALLTMVIFVFIWTWNDFFWPLIYISNPDRYTLTLGLYNFKGSQRYGAKWNYLMAASLVIMLPCVVIFAVFQRRFIEGVAISGLKA